MRSLRFIAGLGLAGELGAGITLVSETLSKEKRGLWHHDGSGNWPVWCCRGVFSSYQSGWRNAYFVGGGLGILLLLLRIGTFESGMFKNIEGSKVSKGNFLCCFTSWERFKKYLFCILIGAPLMVCCWRAHRFFRSPEFGIALHAKAVIKPADGIFYSYIGIAIGDIFAGLLAQITKSRKLTMAVFLLLSVVSVYFYLSDKGITPERFAWLSFFMGCTVGYWATFVTIASEQFGTNIRSTVTTTVPNFVRGALIPITLAFNAFKVHYGMITSGYIMMGILTAIALFSLSQLKETFGKDLDYVEIS
jgi:putative MFS transporter